MDHICLANTCKGLRCSRSKVNENYCKIHTTNEVCSLCFSTQISSTDSILKHTGKSWCTNCIKIKSDEALARALKCVEEHRIIIKAKSIENETMLRQMLHNNRDILERANQYHVYENMINQMFN